jgi:uncharacterized protein YaaQ
MSTPIPDRLAILNVSGSQEDKLFTHLIKEKFTFTVIKSTGGMIQEPEVCLLIGFHNERLPILLDVVRANCRPYRKYISTRGFMQGEMAGPPMLEAELGGARFFMMNVMRFEQI